MSAQIKAGGPAFPSHGAMGEVTYEGMTLRQYAAIKLRVPESGDDWLDDMIRKSLRDEFAAKATEEDVQEYRMYKPLGGEKPYAKFSRVEARWRYADAMLRAREVQP